MKLWPSLFLVVPTAACALTGSDVDSSTDYLADDLAIVVKNNETQAVHAFEQAIRETVFVEAPMDSDSDGQPDRIALDILRPNAAGRVATVMEASPYYRASTLRRDVRDVPLGQSRWQSKFFVPRGYASVEVEMQGTARSTGCPMTGGKEDTASIKAAIDWLNGRARGFYANGQEAKATWSTGSVGMLGVSYNGTLPTAVAAEGVEGLKTIVPIAAISSWYDYTRDQGVGYTNSWGNRYPEYLAGYVVGNAARTKCASVLKKLGDDAGDDSYDYTPFWQERDYRQNLDRIKASVFLVHGLRDWNVKPNHFSRLWYGLAERNVPRKIWLHDQAHVDPVSLRQTDWQTEMHHWMDHWLYGIQNDVMSGPRANIQRPDGKWETRSDWPEAGTKAQTFVPSGRTLGRGAGTAGETQAFKDENRGESQLTASPASASTFRLAWQTEPLTAPLRVSGTVHLQVTAQFDTTSTPLTALLVHYGPQRIRQPLDFSTVEIMTMSCTFEDLQNRTGCAAVRQMPETEAVARIVTRGAIDVKNHGSLVSGTALVPGTVYTVDWDLNPTDYVFPTGHQLGVVLSANNPDYITTDRSARSVTVKTDQTKVIIPVAP